MSAILPFIVAGIATGAIYGLAASGLLVTYVTSGVFNLAYGATAAAGAYVFYWLHIDLGWNWILAFVVSVFGFGTGLGLLFEVAMRNLGRRPPSLQIVATVGVILIVQSLATIKYGTTTLQVASYLPGGEGTFTFAGVHIGWDQLQVTIVACVAVGALYSFIRWTRRGLAMRALVSNPTLVSLHGQNPVAIRRTSWLIGTIFAAASGVLIVPIVGLNATDLTYLVVAAVGAVAIGTFSNLPLTFLGGIAIGIAASVSQKYVLDVSWLRGVPLSLPFLILVVVLLVTPKARLAPPTRPVAERVSAGSRIPWSAYVALSAVLLVLLLLVPELVGTRLIFFIQGLSLAMMLVSLGLLVRLSGQVSLCQAAFAALGAVAFSQFAVNLHLGWVASLLLGALLVVPISALVAIPAIRLKGVFLALATLGFGILLERLVYPLGIAFTETHPRVMPRPSWAQSDHAFYYVALALFVLVALGAWTMTRTRLGRLLRGMAGSEAVMSSSGTSVNVTKVLVFCIAGFIAGLGGIMYGSTVGVASYSDPTFGSFQSLILLAYVVAIPLAVPWVGLLGIPIIVIPTYFHGGHSTEVLTLIFGIGAVAVALQDRPPRTPEIFTRILTRIPAPRLMSRPRPEEQSLAIAAPNGARADLSLDGVRVTFGGLVAVDGVTLKAPPGRITGLIGPNGAGKTTLFNAATGMARLADGKVEVGGTVATRASAARHAQLGLSRTFQTPDLLDGLSVRENVAIGSEGKLAGFNPITQLVSRPQVGRQVRRATDEALELCGIEELADVEAGNLTTGERRLVEVARCLAGDSDVVLLDEPCGGLDKAETEKLRNVLMEVVAMRGCSVLLVEHDMSFVMQVCGYIYVMDFGKLIFEGAPEDVQDSPVVRAAYLGSEGGETSDLAQDREAPR